MHQKPSPKIRPVSLASTCPYNYNCRLSFVAAIHDDKWLPGLDSSYSGIGFTDRSLEDTQAGLNRHACSINGSIL